jgi:hypothetical protein
LHAFVRAARRYAATRGDTVKLRAMLQQGFNPDSADYDGRTAMMLAAVKGHRDVVELLLSAGEAGRGGAVDGGAWLLAACARACACGGGSARLSIVSLLRRCSHPRPVAARARAPLPLLRPGANPRLDDHLGRSALLEACYHGHDVIVDVLMATGTSLSPQRPHTAAGPSSVKSSISSCPQEPDAAYVGSNGSVLVDDAGGGAASIATASIDPGTGASWALQLASLLCSCVYECNLPVSASKERAGMDVAAVRGNESNSTLHTQ